MGTQNRRASQPIEHSLLLTATLCLLAFGVVMVFSASSTTSLLGESGDGAYYLKRTVLFGALGLVVMRVFAVRGVAILRPLSPALLAISIVLCFAVLVPGIGMEVNGARRWIGTGLVQVQPSEVAKLSLVLYGAYLLAARPKMVGRIGTMVPLLGVVALVCGLVVIEPDLGTAMVACLATAAILIAAGARMRDLGLLFVALAAVVLVAVIMEPYRMERLTGFINPGSDPDGSGFQSIQAQIALGSGGFFGVGLGESLQKAFYLPEAHTDMIAAVIGEELGLIGIAALVALYGIFAYAGLRIAQRARDRYGKLLAAGLTSLVVVQAVINLFAVLGLAPLTGVPLPLVSYGNSSMLVVLAAVGLLLNVASGGTARSAARPSTGGARLRVVDGGRAGRRAPRKAASRTGRAAANRSSSGARSGAKGRHSRGGNRGTRRAGARGRRRAAG
jgi:cell division protein FtsW